LRILWIFIIINWYTVFVLNLLVWLIRNTWFLDSFFGFNLILKSFHYSHFNSLSKYFLFAWILAGYLLRRNRPSERLWFQYHLISLSNILSLFNSINLMILFININHILNLFFLMFNLFFNIKCLKLFPHLFILHISLVLFLKIILKSIKILFIN